MDQLAETVITRTTTLVAPATTVTVTVTPTSTPLETITMSRSWITATPHMSTRYDWRGGSSTSQIMKPCPSQPNNAVVRNYCRSHTEEFVGAFFGGLGGGILVLALISLAVRLRSRRRHGSIQLESPHGSVENFLTPRSSVGDDEEPLLSRSGEKRQSGIPHESNVVEGSVLNTVNGDKGDGSGEV